jgi:protein CLEC16A
MSCKVAFERGKERIVYLLVVLHGTSGSLLLVEEITSKQQRGVIRVTAPLAGSDPRVDEKHPTWLHLRIRSPHQPLGDVSTGGPARSSPRMKQLVDGRWTLAFGDAEACKNASSFITQQITTQTNNVRTIITSFLGESAQGLQDAVVVEHSSPP